MLNKVILAGVLAITGLSGWNSLQIWRITKALDHNEKVVRTISDNVMDMDTDVIDVYSAILHPEDGK